MWYWIVNRSQWHNISIYRKRNIAVEVLKWGQKNIYTDTDNVHYGRDIP